MDERLRVPSVLTAALVIVAGGASAMTLWVPSVLLGPAVMNGSARGTALVALFFAVPLLCGSMAFGRRGSELGLVGWLGSSAYLAYNGVLFLFATPFNRLFLEYVAMLALSIWTLVTLLTSISPRAVEPSRSMRFVAGYVLGIVGLNSLAWLAKIVPALLADRPGSFLDGTGIATNPVFVQDLVLWLPAMATAAVMLWSGRRWGGFLVAVGLVFWQLEALGVAVDQWFGHRADPASHVVSMAVVPMFLGLFVVGLLPCWLLLTRIGGTTGTSGQDHGPSTGVVKPRTLMS